MGHAAGDGECAQAPEVGRNSKDIAQIHLERIIRRLAPLIGCCGRHWRQEHIALLEGIGKILTDQGSRLLCTSVIRIIVAAAQHIGPENDATLDLGTKSFSATLGIEVKDRLWRCSAVSISDAIKARQIGRSLCCSNDIIDRCRILGVRQGDINDFRASLCAIINRLANMDHHLWISPFNEIFLW